MPHWIIARRAVALIFAINGFLYANWVARIPLLQSTYQMDNFTLGLVLLSGSIGAWVAMPFTGRVIVRFGSKTITAVSLLIFVALTPLIPITPSMYTLGATLFVLGASTGALDVAMNAQAVVIEQGMGRPIMSSFHAIFSAGMMLGAAAGGWFNAQEVAFGWHLCLASLVALAAALWAVRYLVPEPRTQTDTTMEDTPQLHWSALWRQPELLLLGLIAFCCMLGEGAMADWTTNYLEKVSLATPTWAPLGLFAFSTAMTLMRFLGDGLRMRWGDRKLMSASAMVAAGGLCLALAWPVPAAGILGFFLVGCGLAVIVPIAYSTAGKLGGLTPGVGISLVTTIGYAGFLIGPPLIGFISDGWGLKGGMGFVLLLFLLMLVLNVVLLQRCEQAQGPAAERLEGQ
ncbi:MAG: MFS transporter [Bacteroidetes bacterium]|nr:MAG: MFS transporter [Bacteroidota bacterium]